MLTERIRRSHDDERGVALIVVMAMLLVLGVIAAAVFANSLQIKNATANDRAGKQAYAAALNGLRSAMYWLNASAPADNACPPLPGQTTALAPNAASGVCGPYESDNVSGVSGVSTQPLVNQRFTYWISPVLSSSSDTCTGTSPVVTDTGTSGTTVRDRCITAIGQALVGSNISSTTRVQARVTATNAQFPVPGIFGAACLGIGVSVHVGVPGCAHGNGASNSDYYGTIGSDGPVDVQMKNWNFDPSTASVAPAALYLGYTSPTSATIPTYSIKLQNLDAQFARPTTCGAGLAFCNNSQPPLPYNRSATGPYQNPVHLFGRWYQPFRMGTFFAQPPPMILPGHSLPTGCITTDVSVCNNNSTITTASSSPTGCATLSSNRFLTLANNCVLRLGDGTYDFCGISLGRTSALLPADATANGEIRVFLDNSNRTAGTPPTAVCASGSGVGSISWPNNQPPRWMTTNTATNLSAPDCLTAFSGDPWTALAGQLYAYGAGDPADASTNYPVNADHTVDIPSVLFNGSIIATNSTVNLTASNTCVNGGITGGIVNVDNNAGFKWDPNIAKAHVSQTSTTFYRTAFSTCTSVGFRFASTSTPPTYPTYPSDGC